MKEQLEERLRELRTEFESGQKMLADLEARQANMRDSLLRISGAIQVLEEELAEERQPMTDDIGQLEVAPEPEPATE